MTRRAPVFLSVFVSFCLAACLAVSPVCAGIDPPITETVVVTATLTPEEEAELGAATTVIDRKAIEESGAVVVADLLREVPGLDVVRSGSEGAVTSVFLRGANSTQTLVLVDGVRVNSPYFSGYDFSALTTENVERIEVVRGPFSSLYGSDAMAGVIQIFTRAVGANPALTASVESGSAGSGGASFFGSTGLGPIGAIATYRAAEVDGDRPNSDWSESNASLRLEGSVGPNFRAALEGAILDSKAGSPGPVGGETPEARGTVREVRVALPMDFSLAEGQDSTFLLAHVRSQPTYRNPSDPFFGESNTDARTLQARGTHHWTAGIHSLTALASWEGWNVSADGSGGVSLDDDHTDLWAVAIQDGLRFGSRGAVTLGLRSDWHSEFGNELSPRISGSWLTASGKLKLRGSAGEAFRAPSVGELYYPFVGNPALEPERSRSYEAGVETYFGEDRGSRVEGSVFWNDFRDLIVYDFALGANANIARARTKGVELAWRQHAGQVVSFDVGYTWLEAQDLDAGTDLLRRPRHRAFGAVTVRAPKRLTTTLRTTWVGSRPDVDGLTFAPVEAPAYVRLDLYARYDLAHYAPFLRVDNLTDEEYAEATGYPAPERRIVGGIEFRLGGNARKSP